MIDFDNMTRDELVKVVGEEKVNELESQNCEPTNRVGYNGACQGDDTTEWKAEVSITIPIALATAYYYTTNEQDDCMAEHDGDGTFIDWKVDHYRIDEPYYLAVCRMLELKFSEDDQAKYIFADYPNWNEHLYWLLTASREEIADWLEALK